MNSGVLGGWPESDEGGMSRGTVQISSARCLVTARCNRGGLRPLATAYLGANEPLCKDRHELVRRGAPEHGASRLVGFERLALIGIAVVAQPAVVRRLLLTLPLQLAQQLEGRCRVGVVAEVPVHRDPRQL